jgi:hypothetical protein
MRVSLCHLMINNTCSFAMSYSTLLAFQTENIRSSASECSPSSRAIVCACAHCRTHCIYTSTDHGWRKRLVQWLKFKTSTGEVVSSNVERSTDYSVVCHGFPQTLQGKSVDSFTTRPQTFEHLNKSFVIGRNRQRGAILIRAASQQIDCRDKLVLLISEIYTRRNSEMSLSLNICAIIVGLDVPHIQGTMHSADTIPEIDW